MTKLLEQLKYLKLPFVLEQYEALAKEAAQKDLSHVAYLSKLIEGETSQRQQRAETRRIQAAQFPVIKTLEQFCWSWPKKINRPQVQNLFRLQFIREKSNVVFLGTAGLGKSHLATAIGLEACLKGYRVLFVPTIDVINDLTAAKKASQLKPELKKYLKPDLLILDELGYLPIDKQGGDLLFQIVSHRYERGSLIITSNRVYKRWVEVFNHDSTLTSAALDRLLHHCETVLIEGPSYRMKDSDEK